jgi:hypothetical protein
MDIEGSLRDNLQAAVASAKRLRGHPVYTDTQAYWSKLLALARSERASHEPADRAQIDLLIAKLQQELAERGVL